MKYWLVLICFSGMCFAWDFSVESISGMQTGLSQFDTNRRDVNGFTEFAGAVRYPLATTSNHRWFVEGDGGASLYLDKVIDWHSEGGVLWNSPRENGGWKRGANVSYTKQSSLTDWGSAFEYTSIGLEMNRYWQKKHKLEADYKLRYLQTGERRDLKLVLSGGGTYKTLSTMMPGLKIRVETNYSSLEDFGFWGVGASPFLLAMLGKKYIVAAFADASLRNYGAAPKPRRGPPDRDNGRPSPPSKESAQESQKTLNTALTLQLFREIGRNSEIFVEYVFYRVYFLGSREDASASNRVGLGISYRIR